jgi:hypothetical protein
MNNLLPVIVLLCAQSLADVAREEAARRKALEQQGIEAKVLDTIPQSNGGNLTVSDSPPSLRNNKEPPASRGKFSVDKIRGELQRLDRNIRQAQERVEQLQHRLQAERWVIPRTGRVSGNRDTEKNQNKTRLEIESLQRRMEQWQGERHALYDRGRKAGFLPGELTGKGITP